MPCLVSSHDSGVKSSINFDILFIYSYIFAKKTVSAHSGG